MKVSSVLRVILVLISFVTFVNGDSAGADGEKKPNDIFTTVVASLILVVIFTVITCIFSFFCCGNWFRTPWSSACCCCCQEPSSNPEDEEPRNQERAKLIPKHIGGDTLKDPRAQPQEKPISDLPLDILDQIIPNSPEDDEDAENDNNENRSESPPPPLPEAPPPPKLIRAPAFDIETEPMAPIPKEK